ncbi:hypothetical protein BDZ91DRAFT_758776 [Kalaharituber pfeilii]|nr:hypothetical protein BDZ91DRAFT_758776 [Kalaharituber pfeilii]
MAEYQVRKPGDRDTIIKWFKRGMMGGHSTAMLKKVEGELEGRWTQAEIKAYECVRWCQKVVRSKIFTGGTSILIASRNIIADKSAAKILLLYEQILTLINLRSEQGQRYVAVLKDEKRAEGGIECKVFEDIAVEWFKHNQNPKPYDSKTWFPWAEEAEKIQERISRVKPRRKHNALVLRQAAPTAMMDPGFTVKSPALAAEDMQLVPFRRPHAPLGPTVQSSNRMARAPAQSVELRQAVLALDFAATKASEARSESRQGKSKVNRVAPKAAGPPPPAHPQPTQRPSQIGGASRAQGRASQGLDHRSRSPQFQRQGRRQMQQVPEAGTRARLISQLRLKRLTTNPELTSSTTAVAVPPLAQGQDHQGHSAQLFGPSP